jgi:hypothetical protein
MNEILLLPEYLQRKSLSKREIVLTYDDALKALDTLESTGWVVLGWEPWLKLPNGSHVHPLMGGDFHRAAQLCRQIMQEEQQRWDQGTFLPQDDPTTMYWQEKIPSMVLYFYLTAGSDE